MHFVCTITHSLQAAKRKAKLELWKRLFWDESPADVMEDSIITVMPARGGHLVEPHFPMRGTAATAPLSPVHGGGGRFRPASSLFDSPGGSSALLDSPSPAFKRQRTVMVQNDDDGGSRVVAKSVRPATEMDFHESPTIGGRGGKRRRTSHQFSRGNQEFAVFAGI